MALTDTAEDRVLRWLNPDEAAPARAVAPLKLRLMTANGTDSAPGTEVTGDTYAAPTISLADGGTTTDTEISVVLDSAVQKTIVGVEVWDSAGTPVRWWHGALAASKVVNAGDPFVIPIGDLDLTLD